MSGSGSTFFLISGLAIAVILLGLSWLAARRLRRRVDEADERASDLVRRIDRVRDDASTRDQILSTMEEGVILVEPDGAIGYANLAARRLLGEPPRSAGRLTPPALGALIASARSSEEAHIDEMDVGASGLRVHASAVPVGNDGRVLLVTRDVTQAHRLEAMRRDFVANASHELKTPAASIQATAETVARAVREDPDAAVEFAEKLEREAVRLSRLVSDLLDLSRLETEPPSPEPVRLDVVARDEVERVRDRAAQSDVSVSLEADRVSVRGSAKDLSLLLGNLLDNAVRYTPEGGRVDVRVERSNGDGLVEVRDTGVGIPSRDLPRIFERFYRVDPARSRETGGTGLGLAIARHVAEQHGGRIEAESELGRGSTFRVVLPATE